MCGESKFEEGPEGLPSLFPPGVHQLPAGKLKEAIPHFRQCLSLNAESATAYNALTAIHYLQDDLAEAERQSLEAIKRSPKLSSVRYNLFG